jgi:hypothetical protein
MADVNRVDERIAHQAADQADDAVGGQHTGGRILIARGLGAFDVVHRLDEIVDAERNRGDQDDPEEFEAREYLADGRDRHREAEARERIAETLDAEATESETEQVRAPGDDHADGDGDQPGGNALVISDAAEPAGQDDGETDQPDLRRHVHL